MESIVLLPLLLLAAIVSPAAPECVDGNCTEPIQLIPFSISSWVNILPPMMDSDGEGDRDPSDEVIDLAQPPPTNGSDDNGVLSINVKMQMISFGSPMDEQSSGDDKMPSLIRRMMDNIIANIGILDLSGRTLTGGEVYTQLRERWDLGKPVTTLILSNSRIHALDAGTFAAAESTINTLLMDNCTVNLEALRGFTNLRLLNLSGNDLTTFPWYSLMKDTLEVLDLSHNKFEEIRPELSMLKNLRELDLSYNKLTSVSEEPLALMPNLEILDLSMNMLQKEANFERLTNLKQLELDWNFLDGWNQLRLPSQKLKLKLASNPWGCDCNLIKTRDNNEVLDLDQVQCADHQVYGYCDGCPRSFLPLYNSPDVHLLSNLTKAAIQHRHCNDVQEFYYSFINGYYNMQDKPEKLIGDVILFTALVIFAIAAVVYAVALMPFKIGSSKDNTTSNIPKKTDNRKFWLKVQQFHPLSFKKIGKPQEVPYLKIDEPFVKV